MIKFKKRCKTWKRAEADARDCSSEESGPVRRSKAQEFKKLIKVYTYRKFLKIVHDLTHVIFGFRYDIKLY